MNISWPVDKCIVMLQTGAVLAAKRLVCYCQSSPSLDCRCSSVAGAIALRHSAAFNYSSLAYLCPAVSVSSRAHRLAVCPPSACWTQPRRCHSHLCLPSPSVPLIRGSIPAKMSGRTGAESPFEKTSRHVTESHAQSRVVRYKYRIIYRRGSNRQRSLASLRSLTLVARQLRKQNGGLQEMPLKAEIARYAHRVGRRWTRVNKLILICRYFILR